jgi:hypothetical protein
VLHYTLLSGVSKGAPTRTSLASESGWARVPVSQTRPCVECHEPGFGQLYIYRYTRIYPRLAPEADSRARLVRVWTPLLFTV